MKKESRRTCLVAKVVRIGCLIVTCRLRYCHASLRTRCVRSRVGCGSNAKQWRTHGGRLRTSCGPVVRPLHLVAARYGRSQFAIIAPVAIERCYVAQRLRQLSAMLRYSCAHSGYLKGGVSIWRNSRHVTTFTQRTGPIFFLMNSTHKSRCYF
jgi:hypothetical protein